MAMPSAKGWLAVFFIILCLAIPFGITYYVSTDAFKDRFERFRPEMPKAPENATLEKTRTIGDQVLLVQGERIKVHNSSLIYRGIEQGRVVVDLFLEELDPDRAYVHRFPKEMEKGQVIRLGDVVYTMVSVRPNTLVLKVQQAMGAR